MHIAILLSVRALGYDGGWGHGGDDDDSSRDSDGDGFDRWEDCDDDDDSVYPGADEACDGVDTDCVGGVSAREADDDRDGFAECQQDCDDGSELVNPDAPEICDGLDNDCDGLIDPDCDASTTGVADTASEPLDPPDDEAVEAVVAVGPRDSAPLESAGGEVGCGCQTSTVSGWMVFAAGAWLRRRRPAGRASTT